MAQKANDVEFPVSENTDACAYLSCVLEIIAQKCKERERQALIADHKKQFIFIVSLTSV
jgi:hypothetical protein